METPINNEEQKPKGPGRPRVEHKMPTEWEKIILEAGEQGKHITQFLVQLGISWDTHHALMKRNVKYSEAVKRYNVLCENYWFNQAHQHMEETGGAGYNSRLFSLIMRNKFGDRWSESSKVDMTSAGKELQSNPIQIEIIKTVINKDDAEK